MEEFVIGNTKIVINTECCVKTEEEVEKILMKIVRDANKCHVTHEARIEVEE